MVSREEVVITAIVRGLIDNLGRLDCAIKADETFKAMGLDELDMAFLEDEIEVCLHKTFMVGLKLSDTIRSIVWRLQAGNG